MLLWLVLSSSGTGNVLDADELSADQIQLLGVLDLKADGEHTPAAGQVLAGELFDPDPGSGHGLGHIQKQSVTGEALQFQGGLEGLVVLNGPADPDPAGSLPGIVPVLGVGAVGPVDTDAEALGDEAGDGITGDRSAAFGYDQLPAVGYNYATIQSELASGRPVYVRGARLVVKDNGSTEYKGHAWVADGYKTRTEYVETYEVFPSPFGEEFDQRELRGQYSTTYRYVHYNWGYDGDCNGFFKDNVFRLNNASQEAGGYDNTGYYNGDNRNYMYDVLMITGINNSNTY